MTIAQMEILNSTPGLNIDGEWVAREEDQRRGSDARRKEHKEALASMVDLQGVEHLGRHYVDEVIVTGEKPQIKTADAIIEGWFDGHASTGCWRPKYHIAATKIELVSPVSDYQGPGDDDCRRVKH